ncbi:MAG: D-alanyl-D-alanine carboxypeptidase family protein, partial [Acutalibacteraceae bacterium]
MDTIRNESVQLVNTNKLVRFYRGATGLKTGTTDKAGCCVSATAKRNGMELIAVIMGAKSSNERFSYAKKLLDYGFANLSIYETDKNVKIKKKLDIKDGQKKQLKIKYDKIQNEMIKTEDRGNLKIEISYKEQINAPIKENDIVGNIKVLNNNKQIRKYNIYAAETIDKINFGFSFSKLLMSMAEL